MSKFNIISKDKGNIYGKYCNIIYQLDNKPDKYSICLFCLGTKEGRVGKYAFIDGYSGYGINTDNDKQEFINELEKFQRGSSYRKSHPIAFSELDNLKKQYNDIKYELSKIENKITENQIKETDLKIEKYKQSIDNNSLKVFEDDLLKLFEKYPRYTLHKSTSSLGIQGCYVFDIKLNKPVAVLYHKENCIKDNLVFRDLNDIEITKFI